MIYTEVLTPGYLIRLSVKEQVYEYHTNKKNSLIYCENPGSLISDSLEEY